MASRARFFGLAGALALGGLACGASYQSVYEGDVRFEHCYRLDTDGTISHDAKLSCWSDWTRSHTVGQTRDRVEYALGRERALLGGAGQPAGLVLVSSAAGAGVEGAASGPTIACPLPPNAFEAPPPTMVAAPTASASASVALVSAATADLSSNQICIQDCGHAFTTCATHCKKPPCVSRCGDLAKHCISECL